MQTRSAQLCSLIDNLRNGIGPFEMDRWIERQRQTDRWINICVYVANFQSYCFAQVRPVSFFWFIQFDVWASSLCTLLLARSSLRVWNVLSRRMWRPDWWRAKNPHSVYRYCCFKVRCGVAIQFSDTFVTDCGKNTYYPKLSVLFTVHLFHFLINTLMYRRRKCDWAPVFVFCALQVSASSSWCCWKWVWFWEWRFTSTWSLSN